MNLQIIPGLPPSHSWRVCKIINKHFPGIVWDKKDIRPRIDVLSLYRDWSTVHFESLWYEISVRQITSKKNTLRDVQTLHFLLGERLRSSKLLIDVNCGSGRHVIELSKQGVPAVGMEGVELLRQKAKRSANKHYVSPIFVSTSHRYQQQYRASSDIVISMFNSLGYTFSEKEDIDRLSWMARLLKPGGFLVLDIRTEEFQKNTFNIPTFYKEPLNLNSTKLNKEIKAISKTWKYWSNGILGAEEQIIVQVGLKDIIAQYTTYGWKTYPMVRLGKIFKRVGLKLLNRHYDYYLNPQNKGERIFLVAQTMIL